MKKMYLGLLLLGITGVQAQEHEYVPLLQDGRQWVYCYTDYLTGNDFYALYLNGDTLIAGETYNKCYYRSIVSENFGTRAQEKAPVAYVREEGKKVYAIDNPDNILHSGLIPYIPNENYTMLDDGRLESRWIYDFDNMENCAQADGEDYFTVSDIWVDGRNVAFFKNDWVNVIEGVGADGYGVLISPVNGIPTCEVCVGTRGLAFVQDKDGHIIYKGSSYTVYIESKLPGDVNGDGKVNVSDVTALINIILGVK